MEWRPKDLETVRQVAEIARETTSRHDLHAQRRNSCLYPSEIEARGNKQRESKRHQLAEQRRYCDELGEVDKLLLTA